MGIVIFDGVAYGMLLFLIGVGLSITMGLMNFVNLAHGSFAMVGGYTASVLMNHFGLGFGLSLAAAFVSAAVVGAVLEFVFYAQGDVSGSPVREEEGEELRFIERGEVEVAFAGQAV